MAQTDPQTLLAQAKCFTCYGITLAEALQLALLADIVANGSTGGGGGGTAQLVTYTVAPPANPPNTALPALAYDPTGNLPILGWNTGTLTWN